ncbi:MAG: trypsin-like peptidase domain-containing protein, partial [Candidatus Binatia bacterium]
MTIRPWLGPAAFVGVTIWLLTVADGKAVAVDPVERLMASSVCVLGDVSDGDFEASGFVVPPGSYVMTTAHGIAGATNLRVKLNDGRVFPARLERVGTERADIALLGVVGARLEPATLGSVEGLRPGDAVRTVGCPSGFDFTLSQG